MNTFLVLVRGINVGGKNAVPMAKLRKCLEQRGFSDVSSYIASGNVILRSEEAAAQVETVVEDTLEAEFPLDDGRVRVLALALEQVRAVIDGKPEGFGEEPDTFHSDAIFLMGGIESPEVMPIFNPREGVDAVWPGEGVVYSQRVSTLRTKSRLSVIVASPLYKSMTIRSWGTTVRLWELLQQAEA